MGDVGTAHTHVFVQLGKIGRILCRFLLFIYKCNALIAANGCKFLLSVIGEKEHTKHRLIHTHLTDC